MGMDKRYSRELKKFADEVSKTKSSRKRLEDLDFFFYAVIVAQKDQQLYPIDIPEIDNCNLSYHCDKDSGLLICKQN